MSKRKKSAALIDSDSDESDSGSNIDEVWQLRLIQNISGYSGISMYSCGFIKVVSHNVKPHQKIKTFSQRPFCLFLYLWIKTKYIIYIWMEYINIHILILSIKKNSTSQHIKTHFFKDFSIIRIKMCESQSVVLI